MFRSILCLIALLKKYCDGLPSFGPEPLLKNILEQS
jgi:hypothetical protein